jgi:hypothetical protein
MILKTLTVAAAAGLALTAASLPPTATYAKTASYITYQNDADRALPYAQATVQFAEKKADAPLYLHITIPNPAAIGSLSVTGTYIHGGTGCPLQQYQEVGDTARELTYKLTATPACASIVASAGVTITFRSHRDYANQRLYPVLTLTSR